MVASRRQLQGGWSPPETMDRNGATGPEDVSGSMNVSSYDMSQLNSIHGYCVIEWTCGNASSLLADQSSCATRKRIFHFPSTFLRRCAVTCEYGISPSFAGGSVSW